MAEYHVSRLVVFEVDTDPKALDGLETDLELEVDENGEYDPIALLDEFGPTYDCEGPVRYCCQEGDTVVEEVQHG